MSSHTQAHSSSIESSFARIMYTNAVYFLSSRVYLGDTPGMLNYRCINRVYYAYAEVGLDGGVYVSFPALLVLLLVVLFYVSPS